MKLFSFYTTTHKFLFERYLAPSLPSDMDLHVEEVGQRGKSGVILEDGWWHTMDRKIEMLEVGVARNPDLRGLGVRNGTSYRQESGDSSCQLNGRSGK